MKVISIHNIFLTIWILFILIIGGMLCYQGITHFNTHTNVISLVFFIVFCFIVLGTLIYTFYKFRVIVVFENRIVSFSILKFEKITISFESQTKCKWERFENKGIFYKKIEITTNKTQKISFSDFEYENFDSLIKYTKCNLDKSLYSRQAKVNNPFNNFILFISIGFLLFLTYKTIISNTQVDWLVDVFGCTNLLIIFAAIKRKLLYSKWINVTN